MRWLDFNLVDSIGETDDAGLHWSASASHIGPAVELAFLCSNKPELRKACSLSPGSVVTELRNVWKAKSSPTGIPMRGWEAATVEMARLPTTPEGFRGSPWVAFCKRVDNAARQSGFGDPLAAGLAGAFREMASNALEHSQAVSTAIAGYHVMPGEFEFVVADGGIGIRASLNSASQFCDLADDREAMRLALTEGVSCHGPGTGRGFGYRQLLHSIASMAGLVRVRSGAACIEIRGKGASTVDKDLLTRPVFHGCSISIRCRPAVG